jgi:hypothetical protein
MFSSLRVVPLAGLLLLSVMSVACGSTASSAPPPRVAAPVAPDGGLPPPASAKTKGLFVPSDTGLGAQPTGSGPSTGTEGRSMAPTLGNPGN